MVFRYLAAAAIGAGAMYGVLATLEQVPQARTIIEERVIERCAFTDDAGVALEITRGPFGPRLGDLDYLSANLSHEEKVRFLTSSGFDAPGVLERMAVDLYENRERVANDIYRSIERAFKEGFSWDSSDE